MTQSIIIGLTTTTTTTTTTVNANKKSVFCLQSLKNRFCKKKKKNSAWAFCVIQNQAGLSLTLQESHANADNCLKFISLLSVPCQELANSEPGTIPKLLPRLLNIVRVIWMNSEHYQSRERLNGLLRKVRVL